MEMSWPIRTEICTLAQLALQQCVHLVKNCLIWKKENDVLGIQKNIDNGGRASFK